MTMFSPARQSRVLMLAAVLLPVFAAGVLLAAPATADAAAVGYAVTSPASGAVVASAPAGGVAITLSCPLDLCVPGATGREQVTLVDPYGTSGCDAVAIPLAQSGNSLTGTFDPADPYPAGCGPLAGLPGHDGVWTLQLSGDTTSSQPLTVRIPPATPPAPTLTATTAGLTAHWPANTEPDSNAARITVDGGTSAAQQYQVACAAGTVSCTAGIPESAGTHTVSVAALRATGPQGALLAGADSPATTAVVPTAAAPPSSAAGSPAAAQDAGSGPGAAAGVEAAASSGASNAAAGKVSGTLPTLAPSAFAGGEPQLPAEFDTVPLPTLGVDAPVVAGPSTPAADGVEGPYGKTLNYGSAAPSLVKQVTRTAAGGDPVSAAVGLRPRSFWISLAGALLLALTAMHVRVWTRALAPRSDLLDPCHSSVP